jgi:hypothetical protein
MTSTELEAIHRLLFFSQHNGEFMDIATHYENANFLRELAENLPRISPKNHTPEQVELLQRLADAELAEAEHVEWARRKVIAARADTRPVLTTADIRSRLTARCERFRNAV